VPEEEIVQPLPKKKVPKPPTG